MKARASYKQEARLVSPAGKREICSYAAQTKGVKLSSQFRVTAHISSRSIVRFGHFELDQDAGELRRDGIRVRLQEQPLQVLQILLENPGKVIPREELQKRIWPSDTFVDFDHGINNAMKRLREALGDIAETPTYIETLPRRGYRFLQSIEVLQKTPSSHIASLAVLPLENLSCDPEQEYFADGMTEALITNLAKICALRVTSRTTVMRYKGVRTKSAPEIARELGVQWIVEGSVLRSGDQVRISAQLIDAFSDTHYWAESYERSLRDVLALQAEVARAVVREIRVKITPRDQARLTLSPQVDPEAYEAYLKGRYHWNKRSFEGLNRGLGYFQQAIGLDPLYVAAHAGLADSSSRLAWWGFVPPDQGFGAAKTAALRALEIDSSSSDAHTALSFSLLHYACAFRDAEKAARRGIDLDSCNPLAGQILACCLVCVLRLDEAVAEAIRSARLDPLSPAMQWTVSAILYHSRRYSEAIAEAHRSLELDGSFAPAHWTIALSLAAEGASQNGIPGLEEAVRATGENQVLLGALGYCYAKSGRKADAVRVLGRMRQLSKERYVSGFWQAVICGGLGQYEEAFDLLEAAYREPAPWMAYTKVALFLMNCVPIRVSETCCVA